MRATAHTNGVDPLLVRRTHFDLWCRHLEAIGKAPATISNRVGAVSMFYRWLSEEDLLAKNPAAHIKRPKVPTESDTVGLDRAELGRMNRHSAGWVIDKLARRAGIAHHVHPHALRHSCVTAALDAGVPLRDVQNLARHSDPRTTSRYDRARHNLDRHASYIVAAFVAGG